MLDFRGIVIHWKVLISLILVFLHIIIIFILLLVFIDLLLIVVLIKIHFILLLLSLLDSLLNHVKRGTLRHLLIVFFFLIAANLLQLLLALQLLFLGWNALNVRWYSLSASFAY